MDDSKIALVTGGSRGIGRAVSIKLARLGHRVFVNYVKRKDAADEVVETIRQGGGSASAMQGDVGNGEDRRRLMADLLRASDGRIDFLVNNAGITSPGRRDLLEATEENWDRVFATNLKGPFFLSQSVARAMLASIQDSRSEAGAIINISSISGYAASTDRADYCLTKAALGMMTKLFALRLAEQGIGVFEICPGVIASDMTTPVKEKYDQRIAEGLSPLRRWGQPEDVAGAVGAIAEGKFPFSTGECINVDGGYHIRRLD